MSESFDYGTGHILKPNGVGDYKLHCPKGAENPFVPWMLRIMLAGRPCSCGQALAEPTKIVEGK
jgi:hypothetical protein